VSAEVTVLQHLYMLSIWDHFARYMAAAATVISEHFCNTFLFSIH